MRKIKSPHRNYKPRRFKHGQHPDSLANLKGREPLHGVKKVTVSMSLTVDTKEKFKVVADDNNLSVSELVERIARALTTDDIQTLLLPKP